MLARDSVLVTASGKMSDQGLMAAWGNDRAEPMKYVKGNVAGGGLGSANAFEEGNKIQK